MNAPASSDHRWRKVLQTPISQLLRGHITGPQTPLQRLDTSALPDRVVESIRAITTQLSGRCRSKASRQLVKSCKALLLEGCAETQLVEQLSEPVSIAALIRVTGKTDWVLQTPLPARFWPTVHALVGQKRVRKTAARQMLSRVCRSLQWQWEAGKTSETLIEASGDTLALGGLLYETQSVAPLLDFNLPESLVSVVLNVVKRTRLWQEEKLDTACELCAHFADGLEQGETEAALIKSFGSPKTAARLIRRARLRNRPIVWRAWRRTWQAAATLSAVVLVLWGVVTVRFMVAQPTVKFDLIQEVDDLSRSIPKQDRAWPLYLQGLSKLTPDDQAELYKLNRMGLVEGPGSKNWPEVKAFLANHVDSIESFCQASNRPKLGFINRPESSDFQENREWNKPYELNPPGLSGLEIRLPQTQDLGAFVAPLLTGAIHLAAEEGDADRCLQLLLARLNVASHYRQTAPFIICQVGANGLAGSAAELAGKITIEYPNLFDNKQLAILFQKVKETPIKPLDFQPFERCLYDFLQKAYTDDGDGNGRFTLRGYQILQSVSEGSSENKARLQKIFPALVIENRSAEGMTNSAQFLLLAGPLATRIADRKEMQKEMLYLHELLWKARTTLNSDDSSAETAYFTEYQRLMDSPTLRLKYLPIFIFMPGKLAASYWTNTDKNRVQRDAALILIAAERYRRQHGQFPETAAELVPEFLSAVPVDPYTNKSLQYSIKDGRPVIDSEALSPPEEKTD